MALDQIDTEESQEPQMGFLDHIDVLRKHLTRSAIAVVLATIVVFVYIEKIFSDIILGPLHKDFYTYRKMCEFSQKFYHDDRLCVQEFHIQLQNTEMAGQFLLAFKLAFIVGIIIAMPYILWEIWRFIRPALNLKELKYSKSFVFYVFILFAIGILFGYFVLAPISLNFLSNWSLSPDIKNDINVSNMLSFISVLVLGTGLIFELPVMMYFLAKLGIISSKFLRKYRKYAFVIILIVAAIVTPPDVVSQVILTIPLYGLFELGVMITKGVEKRRAKDEI
ncbi:MAG: twin-arginine translocase subunit TatC [Bacteroidia bacterium]|nr:twin-arginine translocase subunit TatC [Bacteroidia bacterium]